MPSNVDDNQFCGEINQPIPFVCLKIDKFKPELVAKK